MIELDNVGYNYGGGELLSNLSMQLAPGSFHFLTGPSGTGKTTLLKLCYGALTPTSGRVRVFNECELIWLRGQDIEAPSDLLCIMAHVHRH